MNEHDLPTLNVLIVDDDPDMCLLTGAYLTNSKMANFEITYEPNATEAIRSIKAGAFDCCVVDHNLNQSINGIDVIRHAKDIVPVIMVTSNKSDEVYQDAMREGASGFINKSNLSLAALEESIQAVLK